MKGRVKKNLSMFRSEREGGGWTKAGKVTLVESRTREAHEEEKNEIAIN